MNENKFVVDLGDLKITDEQRKKLNIAIHKAVAGELADMGTDSQVLFIPMNDLSKEEREGLFGKGGGITNGIIVRDFKTGDFKDLLKTKKMK